MTVSQHSNGNGNGNGVVPAPVPWAQQAAVTTERKTDRRRQMVHGLPSWDPLPSGEIFVQRHGRS